MSRITRVAYKEGMPQNTPPRTVAVPIAPVHVPALGAGPTAAGSRAGSARTGSKAVPRPPRGRVYDALGAQVLNQP